MLNRNEIIFETLFMYTLSFSQKLPIDLVQAWDFFSSPRNLEKITPKGLALKVKGYRGDKLYPGQVIVYSVEPFWRLSMEWVTEITAVQEHSYFIDEQKFGPYTFWHHEHWFTAIPDGVLIEDIIYYKMPFGAIGKAFHRLKVHEDLKKIFQYRSKTLEMLFGPYPMRHS